MIKERGEGAQQRQVGPSLKVQDKASDLGLVIVLESDVTKGFQHLSLRLDAVWLAYERYDGVVLDGFVENHFGMGCADHLGPIVGGCFS